MIKVIYSDKQVAEPGHKSIYGILSPSATKPRLMAERLRAEGYRFIKPEPLTIEDLKKCHESTYVDNIFDLKEPNGFGTYSKELNKSLLYTNGAMYSACKHASLEAPACALVSGFHHAGYGSHERFGYFCTFNGLVVSAAKMIDEHGYKKVVILDCDMHWGNGTDNILGHICRPDIGNITFGKHFIHRDDHIKYLEWLAPGGYVEARFRDFKPNLIIYQAGADVHVDDPFGGVLTTDEIYRRDLLVFQMAKRLKIPIAWCLAGGYQPDINKVLDIHMGTFLAAEETYKL